MEEMDFGYLGDTEWLPMTRRLTADDVQPLDDEPGGVSDSEHSESSTKQPESPQTEEQPRIDDYSFETPDRQLLNEPEESTSTNTRSRARKPSRRAQEAQESEALLREQGLKALCVFLVYATNSTTLPPEPQTWEQAMRGPEATEW
jgi:hypothetical protein